MTGICLLLATACTNNPRQEAEKHAAPESEVAIDKEIPFDTYEGIMPVADDPGVEVKITLTLRPNQTYAEQIDFANREGENIYREGTYSHEGELLILHGKDGSKTYYHAAGDELHSRDENGQKITDSAHQYTLYKQPVEFAQPYPEP